MPTGQDWVNRAEQRVLEVLAEQHAVVHAELEARIGEGYYQDSGRNVDTHHITTALTGLTARGIIARQSETARGGRKIETITLADVGRTKTKTNAALGRKRLLMARWQGWTQGTQRHPHGTVGPAGERAVRGGILASGVIQPALPGAAAVTRLLNVTLPGALDSAGFHVPLFEGRPTTPVTVIIEVKNLRSWVYPGNAEPFQLLRKGVLLQEANPDVLIAPVLICRKAHGTLFYMAKQLGFRVIEMGKQFCGEVDQAQLDEIRIELGFHDITPGFGPSLRVQDRLSNPKIDFTEAATIWRQTVSDPNLRDYVVELAAARKTADRRQWMDELRDYASEAGYRGGW